MMLDLVVQGGLVVDGTGAPPYHADVAIKDERVVGISAFISERASTRVDADGCIVTPGFIDLHTHMDAQVHWDQLGSSVCFHGVTTAVMGNCGFTIAPARASERALVLRTLERAEDMSRASLEAGVGDWRWNTFPEYLDMLETLPKAINYASYVGHSALRTWVMGERAFEESAEEDDLRQMERQLAASLASGAVGLSTSRTESHETADDQPVPSRQATWEELMRLGRTVAAEGAKVVQMAPAKALQSPDPTVREVEKMRLAALARLGCLVSWPVVPSRYSADGWRDQLALLDRIVDAGGRAVAQTHSRGVYTLLSFKTHLPFDGLPKWGALRSLPLSEQRVQLSNPALRAELLDEAYHGEYGRAIGAEARPPDFSSLRLLHSPNPPFPLVADVARGDGLDPVEFMIETSLKQDFATFFMQPLTAENDYALAQIMKHPSTVMTFSDSGAHVSQIMDSSIFTHLLSYWVRDREEFSVEQAVEMMTSRPARFLGIRDRGVIKVGGVADLNVIDLQTLTPGMPKVVADVPGGGRRIEQRASGIRATIISGSIVFSDGEHTGTLPGQLLRCGATKNAGTSRLRA